MRLLEASRASFPTSLVALGRSENGREKTQETGQKTFLWNGIGLRSEFVDVAMDVHRLSPPTCKHASSLNPCDTPAADGAVL